MDNLECLRIVIDKFVDIALARCRPNLNPQQIVRLPIEIYHQCKATFKMEHQANSILLDLFVQHFYVKDVSKLQDGCLKCQNNQYFPLLVEANNIKTTLLAQIVVRLVILGLSVKLSIQKANIYRHKLKDLISKLQIQLMLCSQESVSHLLIKELEIIKKQFDSLAFMEQLKAVFAKMDVLKVNEWIQDDLIKRKEQFKLKNANSSPYILQNHQENKGIDTKKRSTINIPTTINNEISHQKCQQGIKQNNKAHISSIALANKIRYSGGSKMFSPSIPNRYVFKSSKKTNENENTDCTEQTCQPELITHRYSKGKQFRREVKLLEEVDESFDSKILCPATPPRTNRKH